MKKAASFLKAVLVALLTVILLSNLYLIGARAMGKQNPTVFGFHWAVVMSGSMEPAISVDDLVVSRRQNEYKPGDVITFQHGSSLTTHRILEQTLEGYVTKGDANNTADQTVIQDDRIVGKVILTIPRVGQIIGYLKSPLGMFGMMLIGLLIIEFPYTWNKRSDNGSGGM